MKPGTGMFLVLIPRPDGLLDAFMPMPPNAPELGMPLRIAGECMMARKQVVDIPAAVGLCIGAAAGLSNCSAESFVKALSQSVAAAENMIPGKLT